MTIFSFMNLLRDRLSEHGFSSELIFLDGFKINFTIRDKFFNVVCSGDFKYIEDFNDHVVSVVAFVYSDYNSTSIYLYNTLRPLLKDVYDILFYN